MSRYQQRKFSRCTAPSIIMLAGVGFSFRMIFVSAIARTVANNVVDEVQQHASSKSFLCCIRASEAYSIPVVHQVREIHQVHQVSEMVHTVYTKFSGNFVAHQQQGSNQVEQRVSPPREFVCANHRYKILVSICQS